MIFNAGRIVVVVANVSKGGFRYSEHPHAKRFVREHLPGQSPYGGITYRDSRGPLKHEEYLGMRIGEAKTVFDRIAPRAVREHRNKSYELFEKKLLAAMGHVRALNGVAGGKTAENGANIVHYSPNPRLSQRLADATLNFGHLGPWLARPPSSIGGFEIRPSSFPHMEAPLSLDLHHDGQAIGGVGFLLYRRGGKTVLRITNAQGIRNGGNNLDVLKEFEKLASKQEKRRTYWRPFLMSKVAEYARSKGWDVEGVLPYHFSVLGPTANYAERRRQVRVIRRAFQQAGFRSTKYGSIFRPKNRN